MRLPYDYDLRKLLGDATGGMTTAVTVLPMALAYGVATGLGPIAGMYGAIVVGFCASVSAAPRHGLRIPPRPWRWG